MSRRKGALSLILAASIGLVSAEGARADDRDMVRTVQELALRVSQETQDAKLQDAARTICANRVFLSELSAALRGGSPQDTPDTPEAVCAAAFRKYVQSFGREILSKCKNLGWDASAFSVDPDNAELASIKKKLLSNSEYEARARVTAVFSPPGYATEHRSLEGTVKINVKTATVTESKDWKVLGQKSCW